MNLIVRDYLPTFQKAEKSLVIVIDPGHGGNDPGKVGTNDALEKDINLSIAIKLKSYLEMQGITVIMTRETDDALYKEGVKNKKKSDLQERVRLCNESDAALVISIHQNSYQTENCRGAQVFYFDESTEGKDLAGYIQQSMALNVDAENNREIKANSSYFLLKETAVTTVIVECGFLSNPAEADLLINEEYQTKIAYGIHAGVVAYLEKMMEEDEVK
ncbi:MAG: N-acetylmuramoyl-L-alanine amidase CwlD [Firmicutes bacterium HGW-Firmicutes-1]|jgi:N-acetylmuramoyl-L-alanine amidase|nr:MAG: N-acetylmuramoyl-L-alanine amidase CwlD [Firmicutes bacterium HGW-Firmicutes-1]